MNPNDAAALPLVNAVNAANQAAQAAWIAAGLSIVVLGAVLIIGAVIAWMAWKVSHIEHNTNSITNQLVAATRKLGLAEGEEVGREAEKQDQLDEKKE